VGDVERLTVGQRPSIPNLLLILANQSDSFFQKRRALGGLFFISQYNLP
jgi:hypothetical protein